jgi:general secretion pathway protein G
VISGVLTNPTGRQRVEGKGQGGYTFIEVAIVTAIIGIMASAALPLARVTMQRNREIELRRSLREIRTAIDKYKDAADQNLISPNDADPDAEGYPPTLETLVEGVTPANDTTGRKLRFLRRIPYDPMTRSTDWGLRSSRDAPDSKSWGGQNVFDVYTKFDGKALDGTNYREDW